MENLNEKVAFITGAASGIGLAMAHAFAEQGMYVVLADRDIDRLHTIINEFDNNALAVMLDVTDRKQWQAAKAAALSRFGTVDVLCWHWARWR